ncbi:hypothetical protein Bca4012_098171 [Brassica carinata]
MDPDQTRLSRIRSIDLELLRSSKTIVSRKVDNLDERSLVPRFVCANSPEKCAVNIISQKTLRSLEQPIPKIRREAAPLTSFEGRLIPSLGIVILTAKACDLKQETVFTIVNLPMPFDAIVGRPLLHRMRAVPSVYHQCVKFVSPTGEKTILGSHKQSRACYMTEFRKMPQKEQNISFVCELSVKDPAKGSTNFIII